MDINTIYESVKKNFNKDFISHKINTSWGGYVYIMGNDGHSFISLYFYDGNDDYLYIEDISVDIKSQKQGLGRSILNSYINVCNELNLESYLSVKRDTFVYDWFVRNGYVEYSDRDDTDRGDTLVWMNRKPDISC